MHIRNAPTRLMKDIGYGRGYQYDHNADDSYSGQEHLPDKLIGKKYYYPTMYGNEKIIIERLQWWARKKKGKKAGKKEL